MNEEFKNSVNLQINPKLKKLESSISGLITQIEPSHMEKGMK